MDLPLSIIQHRLSDYINKMMMCIFALPKIRQTNQDLQELYYHFCLFLKIRVLTVYNEFIANRYHLMIYTYIFLNRLNVMVISVNYIGLFISSGFYNYNDFILKLNMKFNVSLSEILYNNLITSTNSQGS